MADKQRSWLSRLFGWSKDKPDATIRPPASTDERPPTPAATVPAEAPAQPGASPASQPSLCLSPAATVPAEEAPSATVPAARPSVSERVANPREDVVPATWQKGQTILGLYEVEDVFEGGKMGLVYKVRHRGWNLDLAVKSPRPEYFVTEQHRANFEREAETWVNLGLHPHVVSCFYVRRLGAIPRVFAEFVEGGSLGEWIKKGRLYEGGPARALERILDVAVQFAWGLGYAHEKGLIHQDVKPGNVMMTPDGTAKVSDFGLARATALPPEGATGARPGALAAWGGMTPAYCSPEQANGENVSRATDVWSWAVSVLEMLVGGIPWAPSPGSVVGAWFHETLPELELPSHLPPRPAPVLDLLGRCFRTDPRQRPDVLELATDLREIYREVTGAAYLRQKPDAARVLADSLNNRAVSLLDLGKPQEAERLWDEALRADGHHPEAVYNRGLGPWFRGETVDDEFLQQLEAARAGQGQRREGAYLLALVHLERGDVERAVPLLEEAAGQASESAPPRAMLQRVRAGEFAGVRPIQSHSAGTLFVGLSADGRRAVSFGEEGAQTWDVASGNCLATLEGSAGRINSDSLRQGHNAFLHLSPDGRYAAAATLDGVIPLWDAETGRCVHQMREHRTTVTCVCFSPDGQFLYSGSADGTLLLWDAGTGQWLQGLSTQFTRLGPVCLGPGGRLAAIVGDLVHPRRPAARRG
jgi:serine/threonine protein kinase